MESNGARGEGLVGLTTVAVIGISAAEAREAQERAEAAEVVAARAEAWRALADREMRGMERQIRALLTVNHRLTELRRRAETAQWVTAAVAVLVLVAVLAYWYATK